MRISNAFVYMFRDRDWLKKILIGGCLSLVPFVGQLFVMSYKLEIIRNLRKGIESPLPEWTDWQQRLIDGLMIFVLVYLYALPVLLLFCIPCLGWILIIPYLFIYDPIAYLMFAKYGNLMDALNIKIAWHLFWTNLGYLIIILLLSILFWFISLLGLLICCIGIIFTFFWASLANAYLIGEVLRLNDEKQSLT